jgi:hypothetical protein
MPNLIADDLDDIVALTGSLWDELRGTRILITGGTGLFGCYVSVSFLWANEHLGLLALRHPSCE